MSDPQQSLAASDTTVHLVRQRYGSRLTAAQLEDVRQAIEAVMQTAAALRTVPLTNSDEPCTAFRPYRQEG